MSATPTVRTPYEPRRLHFVRTEEVGDWRIKAYGIGLDGGDARPEFVDATVRLAHEVYPNPAATDDRYGVGFFIAHDARFACIALLYWWQSENELHQRIYYGPKDDPDAMVPVEGPQAAGCVWELGIVDFERRAWLEDVLQNPGGPDVEAYLSRTFAADV